MFDNLDLETCKILLLSLGCSQQTWEEPDSTREKALEIMQELRKRISKLEGARW